MDELMQEPTASEVCLEELQACIGFAGAIKVIHENLHNVTLTKRDKFDSALERLSAELDGKLRNLSKVMHEQYVRSHPLTIIGRD